MGITLKCGSMQSMFTPANGKKGMLNVNQTVYFFLKKYIEIMLNSISIYRLWKSSESLAESETWTNCPMLVKDFVHLDLNIAAKISESDAEQFQEMCQIFAKKIK